MWETGLQLMVWAGVLGPCSSPQCPLWQGCPTLQSLHFRSYTQPPSHLPPPLAPYGGLPDFSVLCPQPKEISFDSGKPLSSPCAPSDSASWQVKPSRGPGFWETKAGRDTLAIIFLPWENEVKTWDLLHVKQEGGEREREANTLYRLHHTCFQKELQFLL